jgi:hypothetical protein
MALPKDPGKIAESNIRSQDNLAQGTPTEFASNPNNDYLQFAGLGDLGASIGKGIKKVIPLDQSFGNRGDFLSRLNELSGRRVTRPRGVDYSEEPFVNSVQPSLVPTQQETGLVPDVGNFDYQQTQKEVGKKIMSDEGFERFSEQGFKAKTLEEVDFSKNAEAALNNLEAENLQNTEIIKEGRKAVTALDRGWGGHSGAANINRTERVLEEMKNQARTIDGGADFNFKNIQTDQDVINAIDAVSVVHADETSTFAKSRVSNKLTETEAHELAGDSIGLTREILKRRDGEGFGATKITAARTLLVNSAKQLAEMASKIQLGQATPIDKIAFRRQLSVHAAIQAQVKGAQAEIARALQSFNIQIGGELDPEQASQFAKMALENDKGTTDMLADAVLLSIKEKGLEGVNILSDGYAARTKKVVHELFVSSILSSPATQFKNILGNAGYMLYQLPSELIGGVYGDVVRGMRPDAQFSLTEDQVSSLDALIRMKAWGQSFRDALSAAGYAWRNEMPARASKLDTETLFAVSSESQTKVGTAINYVGAAARVPFRLLLSADEFFKTMSMRGELSVKALQRYNHTLRRGGSNQEAMDNASMVLLDPKTFAMDLEIKALHDTMQSDLGPMGKVLTTASNNWFGKFILPFVTAPTNSLKNTALHTPLVQFLHPGYLNDLRGKNGPKAHQNAIGKLAVSSYVGYQVSEWTLNGHMTASMPRTQKERDALPDGWQPYSFVVRDTGFPPDMPLYDSFGVPNGPLKYINYAGFEPVGGILALISDTTQRMVNNNKDGDMLAMAFAPIAATAQYYRDLPMLQGMGDVMNLMERLYTENFDTALQPIARGPVENFPFIATSLQRAIARSIDPKRYVAEGNMGEFWTVEDVEAYTYDEFGEAKYTYVDPLDDKSPNYSKVGMPKKGSLGGAWDSLSAYLVQSSTKTYQTYGLVDREGRTVPEFDSLGEIYGEDQTSFAVNPTRTLISNFTGVKISAGEKPDGVKSELIRITKLLPSKGWPLTNKTHLKGIKLQPGVISDWVNIAKNKDNPSAVKLDRDDGVVNFYEALNQMINPEINGATKRGQEYMRSTNFEKYKMIQNLEDAYMDRALLILMELPGYEKFKETMQEGGLRDQSEKLMKEAM